MLFRSLKSATIELTGTIGIRSPMRTFSDELRSSPWHRRRAKTRQPESFSWGWCAQKISVHRASTLEFNRSSRIESKASLQSLESPSPTRGTPSSPRQRAKKKRLWRGRCLKVAFRAIGIRIIIGSDRCRREFDYGSPRQRRRSGLLDDRICLAYPTSRALLRCSSSHCKRRQGSASWSRLSTVALKIGRRLWSSELAYQLC